MTAYQTLSDARALAATLLALDRFTAADDAKATTLLLLATFDVDHAMRYQGRKYDLKQELQFPRIAYGQPVTQFGVTIPGLIPLSPDAQVWDWDWDAQQPVVPSEVKVAVLYQCEWLLQPKYAKRLEAIRTGLKSQSVGGVSENLAAVTEMPGGAGGFTGLADRSSRIMERYRIRAGRAM